MKRRWWIAAALLLAGCAGHQQSSVDAAGPRAGSIEQLWWYLFTLLGLIFLLVLVTALLPLVRRHRPTEYEPLPETHRPAEETERKFARVVTAASVVSIIILFVLIIVSVRTGMAISQPGSPGNSMVVEVTGNQWWWSIRYPNSDPSRIVVTANEIHIPVGRPVMIRGMSLDVIHSFWIPNLQGKRDLIPSHVTTEWIQADHPGRYRGQCAEFCGLQHAHMALWVVAEPEEKFEAWMEQQLQPAVIPSDAVKLHGQQVFLNSACVFCHSITGTPAAGQNGPDLTHFGSRLSIAAGTLPNTKGNLSGWITDPQTIKPGNHMATLPILSTDVQPLTEYLESLK